MSEQRWTKQPPTRPGFYWWRSDRDCEPDIVEVDEMLNGWQTMVESSMPVGLYPGEWFGPLALPGEGIAS